MSGHDGPDQRLWWSRAGRDAAANERAAEWAQMLERHLAWLAEERRAHAAAGRVYPGSPDDG